MGQIIRRDVDDRARWILRNHQRMPGSPRHDVEKREHFIVLEYLVGRQFAAKDFGEDIVWIIVRHGALQAVSSVSRSISKEPPDAARAINRVRGRNSCGTARM